MTLFECCKKCTTDRHAGCHGTCERYLADRAKLDEINALRAADIESRTYVITSVNKNKKKNSRKRKGWNDKQ